MWKPSSSVAALIGGLDCRSMRPKTSAALPRSRSVSRLTSASSKALRSKRAWNVPPRSASLRSRSRHAAVAALLEAVVGVVDVGLLVGEIRMVLRHRYQ